MKAAFIRQATTSTFWAWKSLRYPGAEMLLDAFVFKSKTVSLAVELEADIWIVEGFTPIVGSFLDGNNGFTRAIMQRHKCVPLSAIPWEKYDVVLSIFPFLSDKIIKKHPNILWTYYCLGHISKLFRKSRNKPYGKYDLFLDHSLVSEPRLKTLLSWVAFPFPTNHKLLRELIQPTNESAVFLDTRLTKREPLSWFRKRCELPICCSPQPASNGQKVLGEQFTKTKEYLKTVGMCKFFLLARKSGFVGQAALEAAALGLIVVSGPGVYPSVLCHPRCLTAPNNPRQGLNAIKSIEKDVGLQEEILAYQDAVLQDVFWEKPLAILRKGLEMKRK